MLIGMISYLLNEDYNRLVSHANEKGVTISAITREAIDLYCERHKLPRLTPVRKQGRPTKKSKPS